MNHPHYMMFLSYMDGELKENRLNTFLEHLTNCDKCSKTLEHLYQTGIDIREYMEEDVALEAKTDEKIKNLAHQKLENLQNNKVKKEGLKELIQKKVFVKVSHISFYDDLFTSATITCGFAFILLLGILKNGGDTSNLDEFSLENDIEIFEFMKESKRDNNTDYKYIIKGF